MSRNNINRVLNLLLYLAICFLLGTGLMLWLRLPPGSRGGRGLTVWGLDRHEWGDYHLYVALGFAALSIVHLLLNWTWMVKIAASRRRWRIWAGLAAGIILVIALVSLPVDTSAAGDEHDDHTPRRVRLQYRGNW